MKHLSPSANHTLLGACGTGLAEIPPVRVPAASMSFHASAKSAAKLPRRGWVSSITIKH
jgi:hypothetical protein